MVSVDRNSGVVERLRNHISVRRQSPAITNPRFRQEVDLMADAVDEIERLQADLKDCGSALSQAEAAARAYQDG